ncbi:40958_t:CDS:2 [Gigaspora margarita]|uniref:40958_t:CDS:1 n=1 Tax=Gigaspora margarita TaxID=4874 RepID=A0ABN7WFT5_GIGMA|nr:40958_t:CDS:2 [Gigaspora margarita]
MAFFSAMKFSINFIAKHWLYKKYQDNDLGMQPLVNLLTVFLSELSEAFTNCVVHLSISAKKAIKKKKAYAETIGIVHKAINIAIEKDDQPSASSLGQQSNLIEECSESNIVIEKSSVIVSNSIKKIRRD